MQSLVHLSLAAVDSAEWIKTLTDEAAKGWLRQLVRGYPWITEALHRQTAEVTRLGRYDLAGPQRQPWPVLAFSVKRPAALDVVEKVAVCWLFLNESGQPEARAAYGKLAERARFRE